jgi:pyruvate,orthophosphate dikinase
VTHTYALDGVPAVTLDEARQLVGGKAANLAVMSRDLGLPVPPGFVISTATCRTFLASGWPNELTNELRARMAEVEATVGHRFGDASDPLLVSVRSGAPISMPGMMDTILDLGLTDATTAGLAAATGDEAFARACRDRFDASFRAIVGIDDVPADPWAQLRLAIEAVFRSWQSPRARAYRAKEGIPDDLGTAVTVQAMVFGNRGADSGTGVVFTRDPATGERRLFGDILFDAQGEDVVAGTHATESIDALAERLPAVDAELRAHADRLERHFRDVCDIEFTIEDGRLWFLQVRVGKRSPQAALRIAVDMAQDPDFPLTRAEAVERVRPLLGDPPRIAASLQADAGPPLATGLGASPGVVSGPIVTTPDAAVAAAEAGTPAILVRAETSPDDVHGMARAAGILTARGGLASHAAVVARGWGIPAVVGAAAIEIGNGGMVVAGRELPTGSTITIDGAAGVVYEGAIAGSSEVVPEVATLLAWAAEAGIGVDAASESAPTPASASRAVEADELLIPIAIKGLAPAGAIADATATTEAAVQPVLDQLVDAGWLATTAGAYRLTELGSDRVAAIRRQEADAWSHDAAGSALDAFIAIDHQVKDAVTAWQLRDVDGQPVPNDHADADYDAAVIGRLAAVHEAALAWLAPAEAALARLATYRIRLTNAIEQIRGGDGRFVASPRVDSYHGIWFELHEDLIALAGRTRAEEAEAGRA